MRCLALWCAVHLYIHWFGSYFRHSWEYTFETDDNRERWLPKMTDGSVFGFTDPSGNFIDLLVFFYEWL